MMYRILRTDKAEDQLRDIMHYIAEDAGLDVALRYLDNLEAAINRLQEFPSSGSTPRHYILKKQGYKIVIVEKHLVFYKIREAEREVIVYAIIDGRREYRDLI